MTVLSGAAGGFFGLLAQFLYPRHRELLGMSSGALLGAAAGLVVGLAWCGFMVHLGAATARSGGAGRLGRGAVVGGMVAGCAATVLLHVGLQLVHGFHHALANHLWGQPFGLVAGFFVGAIGALVWPPVPKEARPT
jgi:hypothetical protein